MAKAKKNALIESLKRSASGWVNAIKYVNSGKWADDFSKAVHRNGAGKRAQERAKAAPMRFKSDTTAKVTAYNAALNLRNKKLDIKSGAKEPIRIFNNKGNEVFVQEFIRNAQEDAAKKVTKVSAHNRQGSNEGVIGHQRKLTLKKQRAAIVNQLLNKS